MKVLFFVIFLISVLGGGLRSISKVNEYNAKAALAFKKQQYHEAIVAYEYLLHDLEINDDQVRLNLAHTYYKANRFKEALQQYHLLADNKARHLRSVVHLQLGNIATKQKKYKQALSLYKQALVADPANEAARYNFELLKKFLNLYPEREEQPADNLPQPDQTQPSDSATLPPPAQEELQPKNKPDANGNREEEIEQPQPDANGQQGQGGTSPEQNEQPPEQKEKEEVSGTSDGDVEGKNKNNQFDPKQQERNFSGENVTESDASAQTKRIRLQKANISPEKARILLDAMRNAEMQYIQQLPKKATKKPDKSKPDW
ncbi:tetratricopeptide repeat protein [uncultured Pontibacter sp.]|uniref:tetratricopeptide repeat protein n=1 Tax=uncultured Pontibacter sp. TaxID=453356 RepID=UPI002608EA43|nr:tetratricopeptide repeat protein [uncultured Pontibacter sp.]